MLEPYRELGGDTMYQKILIATDGTELASKAMTHGLALAKTVGASVVIVTVTELWSVLDIAQRSETQGAKAVEEYEKWAADYATAVLANASETADDAGVPYETRHINDSHPADGILKAAEDANCDLIVMSTHGRTGVNRLVLGSEAVEVLTHTKTPVLIVR